jgi:glycosyltransferase involved in cell wall biosynthesis
LRIPDDAFIILTAAAIKRGHKRVDYLLGEFARLRATVPGLPVWLVVAGGRDSDTDELVAMGRRLLGDRVRFLVSFPRQRMPELYRAADVFALCSLREMMPVALLEATATGLPCLVHRYPVIEWIVGPGGVSLDMAEPGALSTAATELLCDGPRLRSIGASARRQCEGEFGATAVVDRIVEYYRRVVAWDASMDGSLPGLGMANQGGQVAGADADACDDNGGRLGAVSAAATA